MVKHWEYGGRSKAYFGEIPPSCIAFEIHICIHIACGEGINHGTDMVGGGKCMYLWGLNSYHRWHPFIVNPPRWTFHMHMLILVQELVPVLTTAAQVSG